MINLIEMIADPEDCAFDQPCEFGYRVEHHAVYCHSDHPNALRKCRRTWYTGGKIKDEDCEFYKLNPNFK